MPIQLSISEMCEEIRYIRDGASDLLDPSAPGVLHVFEQLLRSVEWETPGHITYWELRPEQPLKTEISHGQFYFNGKVGPHKCLAEITCIWGITPVKPRKGHRITTFQVVDIASVRVDIREPIDDASSLSLGSWRMELGAANAPGCFFHVQILSEKGRTECPFPHSLDVPRLPSIVFTPMAVTEFVLGELFQDDWRSLERQSLPDIRAWGRIQKERFKRLFAWHQIQVAAAPGSPWSCLKGRIPDADWFTRADI